MDRFLRQNTRWIVALLVLALIALAVWIALQNDVPNGAYQP